MHVSALLLTLQGVLSQSEITWLTTCKHRPMGVAMVLSDICSRAAVSQQAVALMNEEISLYVNMTGACERILKTAIPIAYSR